MLLEWLAGTALGGVGGLFSVAMGGLSAVIGTVPGGSSLTSGIVVGWSWLNTFLPLSEVGIGIVFLLSVYIGMFGFRLVLTVWAQIPIVGGHG